MISVRNSLKGDCSIKPYQRMPPDPWRSSKGLDSDGGSRMRSWRAAKFGILFRAGVAATLILLTTGVPQIAKALDIYDAAVAHTGRPAADHVRDITDHPATLLRFAGIKPGMHVIDFLAADGYYSELLSYIVGPSGHVVMLNNEPYDDFSMGWSKRIASNRLANVEHRTVKLAHMDLAPKSQDAILMIKVYHDLYWVSPKSGWPKVDVPVVLDQLVAALRPGGVLLLVDHSAKPGTGIKDVGRFHRIDENYARQDFESHGLQFVKESDALRNPADRRDTLSFTKPALGHTNRFVMLFRKPPAPQPGP